MTTDAHPKNILVPRVLWAQRKDIIYLSIEVFDVQNEKIELDNTHLSFSGVRSADNAHFAVDLEFYAPIDASTSKKCVSGRNVSFVLEKTSKDEKFWPRLVSTAAKLHYIHIDFSKWVDEDEVAEASPLNMGDYSNFDFGNYGGAGLEDEEESQPEDSGLNEIEEDDSSEEEKEETNKE